MNEIPHLFWSTQRRYGYWAVDLYYYPSEYVDVSDNPEKFMHEPWFDHMKGAVFAGTRKDAEAVARLLNNAYWRGVETGGKI